MVLCGLAAVLLSSCLIQNNKQKLSDSLTKYNVALRWGAVEWAAEHVAPESRQELLVRGMEFGDLKMSQCKVGSVKLKGKDQATALVRIDWYMGSSLRLRTSIVEQKWKLRSGKWLITSQRLVGGAPCPLFLPRTKPRVRISELGGE
jgi:hypothetical protein